MNEKSSNKTSDVIRKIDVNGSLKNDSDSCIMTTSKGYRTNNFDGSKIFSPMGSKKSKLEQQNVEAILNDDDERFQNDNTTNNIMNLNHDSEHNVLSRSIINADTNGCSDQFSALSIPKDVVW
jgi:hypothetical protein